MTEEERNARELWGLEHEVLECNLSLKEEGLVTGTSGNVSGRLGGLMVIKPSGIPYRKLTAEMLVRVDIETGKWEGLWTPSIDTDAHREIYRQMPRVFAIAHTHSPYATAFAVAKRPIQCLTTAQADALGGAVPVAQYAAVGDAGIGMAVAAVLNSPGVFSGACLLASHGVIATGSTPGAAVKRALAVEEAAKVNYLVLQGKGSGWLTQPLPETEIRRLHEQHKVRYGQR